MKMIKKANYDSVLTNALNDGIITIDDVMNSDKEDIMATILKSVHPYKIKLSGDRYVTYVRDETKPNGRRQVRKKSLTDLHYYLIEFYGINTNQKDITFAELFDEWIEYKKQFIQVKNRAVSIKNTTLNLYISAFDKYFRNSELANMSIHKITSTKFELIFMDIVDNAEMDAKSVDNALCSINQMFAYARRSEYLDKNIISNIDKKLIKSRCIYKQDKLDRERILTDSQLYQLRQVLLAHQKRYPYYMPDYAIELAIYTGMRIGELSALHWSDIDEHYININYSEHKIVHFDKTTELIIDAPKNKKRRTIALTPAIRDLLQRIKDLGLKSKDDFIFVDKNGVRYNNNTIAKAVQKRGKKANIPYPMSIHRIRRTVSSNLNNLMPKETVALMLGHSAIINEKHYSYSTLGLDEEIKALETMSSKVINFQLEKDKMLKAE